MALRSRPRIDPFEGELERTFNPGAFIPYRACSSYVGDLEEIEGRIAALTGSDPARAEVLYETFLAGCYEKASELDDSSGSFGAFVEKLFCGWVKARQKAGADPADTSARLLSWMTTDPHGYCGCLEVELAKAFDKAGLAAFSQGMKERVENARGAQEGEAHLQRRWGQALRNLYLAGKRRRDYDEAVIAFGKARLCFQRAGLAQEWDRTVAEVRAEHRRKLGFIADFERLMAGYEPVAKPSLLERAKANWQKGTST